MAQATSGEKIITVDGEKYRIRTQVVYQDGLGTSGTLSTTAPIRYTVEYLPLSPIPIVGNPLQPWILLGERDTTSQNNWIFTPAAGAGFRRALIDNGPTSLTVSLDDSTSNALSRSSGVTKQQATQILQVAPNVAATAADPDQPTPGAAAGPDDSEPASVPLFSENKTIAELGGTIKSGASEGTVRSRLAAIDVRYPEKLDDTTQDSIVFRLKEITGRDFSGTNRKDTNFSFGAKALSDEFGRVILPIQPSISDSNGVDWGGSTLDPLSAYAGRASLAIQQSEGQVIQAITEQFKLAAEQFKRNYGDYKQAINLYLAQEAVGAQGLFSRATGAILNPNLELLFNGPTLRSFNFTFRLSPRSEGEAKIVKDIIYFFKAGMAVRTASIGVFLKAPYVFSIKYCSGPSSQHKSLNKIRDCALLGCDVDYTPDGSYMTFNDEEKTMTSYQLTLRFGELDPLYNDFYADSHPIGF